MSFKKLEFRTSLAALPHTTSMEENMQEMSENNVYELGFILVPSITEERLAETFGALKAVLETRGGVSLTEEFPKMTTLAYTMEKTINNKIERFREGYFGWIKFELAGSEVAELERQLRLRDDVIRHLLISTVRENTIAARRTPGVRRAPKAGTTKDAAPEMSKEEIDREIDALVDDKPAA